MQRQAALAHLPALKGALSLGRQLLEAARSQSGAACSTPSAAGHTAALCRWAGLAGAGRRALTACSCAPYPPPAAGALVTHPGGAVRHSCPAADCRRLHAMAHCAACSEVVVHACGCDQGWIGALTVARSSPYSSLLHVTSRPFCWKAWLKATCRKRNQLRTSDSAGALGPQSSNMGPAAAAGAPTHPVPILLGQAEDAIAAARQQTVSWLGVHCLIRLQAIPGSCCRYKSRGASHACTQQCELRLRAHSKSRASKSRPGEALVKCRHRLAGRCRLHRNLGTFL